MALFSKKLSIVAIFDALRQNSNPEHPLTQREIQDILATNYGIEIDRKAVKRNLDDLEEFLTVHDLGGYYLEHSITGRGYTDYEGQYQDNSISSGYYLDRKFTNGELRFLIDSVIFSKHIHKNYAKRLIRNLYGLGDNYLSTSLFEVSSVESTYHAQTDEIFMTIEELDRAITTQKMVSFDYYRYGIDKKLHPYRDQPFIVNPYRLIAANEHYYLVGNIDKYDNLSHFRIDKIRNISVLSERSKPQSRLDGASIQSSGEYLAEHTYMHSGEAQTILIQVRNDVIGAVIDRFGNHFTVTSESAENVIVQLKSNPADVYYWALQYGDFVTVLEPQELRYQIRKTVEMMYSKYVKKPGDWLDSAVTQAKKTGILKLWKTEDQASNILSELQDITYVSLDSTLLSSIRFLSSYSKCESVFMKRNTSLKDYSTLTRMPHLKDLRLMGNEITDISFLCGCKGLKTLMIWESSVLDYSPLFELTTLKQLYLTEEALQVLDTAILAEKNKNLKVFRMDAWINAAHPDAERVL